MMYWKFMNANKVSIKYVLMSRKYGEQEFSKEG